MRRREQFYGDEHGWEKTNQEADDPHEGAGKNLIVEGRNAEDGNRLVVRGIEHAITKSKERAQCAAGKHSQKEIERDGPAGPACFGGERLDHRPPEEDGSEQEAGVLDIVPGVGTQSQFEQVRNMPGEERDSGDDPADQGMSEEAS